MSNEPKNEAPVTELNAPVEDNEMPQNAPVAEQKQNKNYEQQINKMSAQIDYLNSKIAQLEVQIETNKTNPNKPKNIIF